MSDTKGNRKNNIPNTDHSLRFYYKKYDDIDTVGIGKRMCAVRESVGYTAEAMAERLKVSYSGLRKVELGESVPSARMLFGLHELLGIDLVWLLYGKHTLHDDLLSALYATDDAVKFDIFVRLFSYFSTNDNTVFSPSNNKCGSVQHFAKWDFPLYRPLQKDETPDEETEYEDSFELDAAMLKRIRSLNKDEAMKMFELFKTLKD